MAVGPRRSLLFRCRDEGSSCSPAECGDSLDEPKALLEGICFPEAPRWRDGRLYFSDMRRNNCVMAVDLDGRAEKIVDVPGCPSGIGWLPDGRMIVVSMEHRKVMRLEKSGELIVHTDLVAMATGPLNDMVVDRQGRAYVGNFGFDMFGKQPFKPARLAMVHPNGMARDVAKDLAFPNGMVITPDGKTIIVAESGGRKLTAFDIEVDGSLINRRTWAECDGASPDGICLDAEGGVWIASPNKGAFIRFIEGGQETDRITLPPEKKAIACMLGGEDRRTLFLCTVKGTTEEVNGGLETEGFIETVRVDVPGAGWP